jgi:flagellar motor switch protein FliN
VRKRQRPHEHQINDFEFEPVRALKEATMAVISDAAAHLREETIADPVGHVAPAGRNLDAIMQIPVAVKVVLGAATMPVAALVKLGRGSVVALDRKVGEPVDVTVNGRLVARGEVVVLEDDNSRFGISLTEVVGLGSANGTSR